MKLEFTWKFQNSIWKLQTFGLGILIWETRSSIRRENSELQSLKIEHQEFHGSNRKAAHTLNYQRTASHYERPLLLIMDFWMISAAFLMSPKLRESRNRRRLDSHRTGSESENIFQKDSPKSTLLFRWG